MTISITYPSTGTKTYVGLTQNQINELITRISDWKEEGTWSGDVEVKIVVTD